MALHPDPSRFLVATGQVSGHGNGTTRPPHIRIWNYNTLETVQIIESGFERQILALAFSIEDNGKNVSLFCIQMHYRLLKIFNDRPDLTAGSMIGFVFI